MGLCAIHFWLEWKLDEIRLAGKGRVERFQLAAVFNHTRIEALAAAMDPLPATVSAYQRLLDPVRECGLLHGMRQCT